MRGDTYLSIDEKSVFYHRIEAYKDPPVIFLHDSLGSCELWRDFPQNFAENLQRNVVVYDRLGYGKSSSLEGMPSVHFIREEATFLIQKIITALEIGNFYLLGHSVGGAMALEAAAQSPNCLGVIALSPQAFVEKVTLDGVKNAEKTFRPEGRIEKLKKYHGAKAEWIFQAWIKTWLNPAFQNWSLKECLPKVQCPVLAMLGDRDEYSSKASLDLIGAFTKKSKQMLIPDCGHAPHKEKTELVLNEARTFFDSCRS